MIADHAQWNFSLIDVNERFGGAFSGMNGLVDLFANDTPDITNPK